VDNGPEYLKYLEIKTGMWTNLEERFEAGTFQPRGRGHAPKRKVNVVCG